MLVGPLNGGPRELVSDESRIRLPIAPRGELVGRVSSAMATVVRDPRLCERMSDAGIDRVRRCFTWSRKAAQIVTIYRDLLGLPHADLTNTSIGPLPQEYRRPRNLTNKSSAQLQSRRRMGFIRRRIRENQTICAP